MRTYPVTNSFSNCFANGSVFPSENRTYLGKESLLKNELASIAQARASIAKITVENSFKEVLNTCTGFVIDEKGFLLAPEYLIKTREGQKLFATFTTLREYLPKINDSEYMVKWGETGLVEVKVPLKEISRDESRDISLLKTDMKELEDPWKVVGFSDDVIEIGQSTYTINQEMITKGQFLHFNLHPEFSYITSNSVSRSEVGSPCLDKDGNAFGIATRYMRNKLQILKSTINFIIQGGFPKTFFNQITYNLSDVSVDDFIFALSKVHINVLKEGKTLLSSNNVKRLVEN